MGSKCLDYLLQLIHTSLPRKKKGHSYQNRKGIKPMGEKENQSQNEGEKKVEEKKDDGGKKEDGSITAVLKVDLHCEGCAKKVKRAVKGFQGVEDVKGDFSSNKLTVIGKMDPVKLRERIEQKTKKKVELISPLPSKDKDGGDGDKKTEEKSEKKPDDKKIKQAPATTVVLKIRLHCDGCIQKIRRIILKIKGVESVNIDAAKDLVKVTGTMDVKGLTPYLKDKLKRSVEIVPEKKDDEKKGKEGGGEKKDKEGGGEKKDNEGGGEKKNSEGGEKKDGGGGGGGDGEKKEKVSEGGGDDKAAGGGGGGGEGEKKQPITAEVNKYDYYAPGYVVEYVYPPQLFSDENPNACSIM
ncbi:heavy metal-associated isoprenylated plant protein 3-like [Macadamia integrifolia]|uniref:heavy metal-associated isoprenylated plant protein 3-like n=1 Tax=Macadamia integrifolia TaxID=60698 RepID=UPI001C4E7DA8|nr:heavy metal-associated isoprenylated plant protein 3-like [Macadamia integrifolia]